MKRPSLFDTSDCGYTECRRPSELTLGRPTNRSPAVLTSSWNSEAEDGGCPIVMFEPLLCSVLERSCSNTFSAALILRGALAVTPASLVDDPKDASA